MSKRLSVVLRITLASALLIRFGRDEYTLSKDRTRYANLSNDYVAMFTDCNSVMTDQEATANVLLDRLQYVCAHADYPTRIAVNCGAERTAPEHSERR